MSSWLLSCSGNLQRPFWGQECPPPSKKECPLQDKFLATSMQQQHTQRRTTLTPHRWLLSVPGTGRRRRQFVVLEVSVRPTCASPALQTSNTLQRLSVAMTDYCTGLFVRSLGNVYSLPNPSTQNEMAKPIRS